MLQGEAQFSVKKAQHFKIRIRNTFKETSLFSISLAEPMRTLVFSSHCSLEIKLKDAIKRMEKEFSVGSETSADTGCGSQKVAEMIVLFLT
jgi:hypothetical protein